MACWLSEYQLQSGPTSALTVTKLLREVVNVSIDSIDGLENVMFVDYSLTCLEWKAARFNGGVVALEPPAPCIALKVDI